MRSSQHFALESLPQLRKTEYWRSLNPAMNVTGKPFQLPAPELTVSTDDITRCKTQMSSDGYYVQPDVLPIEDVKRMRETILNLAEHGLPPVFGFIYDEFWCAFRNVASIAQPILGKNYQLVTNFWAWNVEANNENTGFQPHRDIHSPTEAVLGSDGLPLMSTVWIPLTDVTPDHSCMYVLPTCRDPKLPISENNPLHDKIAQEQIMDIRALPARAGSVISWNMAVLHWGSGSSEWASGPRISIAAYLKRSNVSGVRCLALTTKQPLTLDCRIGLIGVMLAHYDKASLDENRYSPELIDFCADYKDCRPEETRFSQ